MSHSRDSPESGTDYACWHSNFLVQTLGYSRVKALPASLPASTYTLSSISIYPTTPRSSELARAVDGDYALTISA